MIQATGDTCVMIHTTGDTGNMLQAPGNTGDMLQASGIQVVLVMIAERSSACVDSWCFLFKIWFFRKYMIL